MYKFIKVNDFNTVQDGRKLCRLLTTHLQVLEHADHADPLQLRDAAHGEPGLQAVPHRGHRHPAELQLRQHQQPPAAAGSGDLAHLAAWHLGTLLAAGCKR